MLTKKQIKKKPNREQFIKLLQKEFPDIKLENSEDKFPTAKNAILFKNGTTKKGYLLFDYYAGVGNNEYYLGASKEIDNFLKKHGWDFEWYDTDNVFLFLYQG